MEKLINFPDSFVVSLDTSQDRRDALFQNFEKFGVENYNLRFADDGRVTDYLHIDFLKGETLRAINSGHAATLVSHLKCIKEWVDNYASKHLVMFEDDITLDNAEYWDFTWNEFMESLPQDWEVIQLSLVRSDPLTEDNMKLNKREWDNWGAGAYMMTRAYAKKLMNAYYKDGVWDVTIPSNPKLMPIIENVIYSLAGDNAYTYPLFNENSSLQTTFFPNFCNVEHNPIHVASAEFTSNWWKDVGGKHKETPLELALNEFVLSPEDPNINYKLGKQYEALGQTASAISYYLRASERTEDINFQYECLIRTAICFNLQGNRTFTSKGIFNNCIALLPNRPEAYYLLSRYYEYRHSDGDWLDMYMLMNIAMMICDFNNHRILEDVGYPGKFGILFQLGLSGYNCGFIEDAKKIFDNLIANHKLDESHRIATQNNINYINTIK